jgi:membrane protein
MDVATILEHPVVAHVMRTVKRFGNRLGNQFAGAITYFSVLAMVPILMFAFAIAGMTLTEFRPDLLVGLKDSIAGLLQGAPGEVSVQVMGVIDDAIQNWRGIGLIGLASLAYAGSGWIGNLKSAVRAQFRPAFDMSENKANIVVETLKNLIILLALLIAVAVTFGVASLATSLTGTIIDLVGLTNFPGIQLITRVVSFVISLATGWLLFVFLYRVLPEIKPSGRVLIIGALIGSAALAILQYFTGFLVGSFLSNPAAALFGPVIVLMLFFNLFARLILVVAAWIATANQPAVALQWTPADKPLLDRGDVVTIDGHWDAAEVDRQQQDVEKADAKVNRTHTINMVRDAVPGLHPDPGAEKEAFDDAVRVRLEQAEAEHAHGVESQHTNHHPEQRYAAVDGRKYFADAQEPVARSVAERRARTSLATGYAAGLATGSGLGALVTLVLGRLRNRS